MVAVYFPMAVLVLVMNHAALSMESSLLFGFRRMPVCGHLHYEGDGLWLHREYCDLCLFPANAFPVRPLPPLDVHLCFLS